MSRAKGIPPVVRKAVQARSHGLCEVGDCRGPAQHLHHRKLRSQGGQHSLSNLLHVCHLHHQWIHEHPAESYEAGWLVKSWDEAS